MLQIYRETRRRFFDHPAVRIEGATARAARNCRTPEALTPQLQIVLTLRGAFVYERGSSQSLLTANQALFIAAGDVSRDRFVDDQPLDYMLVTPHGDAVATLLGDAAAAGLVRLGRETRVAGSAARLQRAASALWNVCLREQPASSSANVERPEEHALLRFRHDRFQRAARRQVEPAAGCAVLRPLFGRRHRVHHGRSPRLLRVGAPGERAVARRHGDLDHRARCRRSLGRAPPPTCPSCRVRPTNGSRP
ncbi:MAG: AraC family ligand binding domain-containing protein [Steroidobacteraceae bacterium]